MEPDQWLWAERVVAHGTRLYYGLGPPRALRGKGGGFRRDQRGRLALEAFAGLPTEAMYERLDEQRLQVEAGGEPDAGFEHEAFRELIDFVEEFGPLGLEWSRIHWVDNVDADRLARQNAGLRALSERLFPLPDPEFEPPREGSEWRVVLPRPGTLATGRVERAVAHRGLAWEDRVRAGDDVLLHDELGPASGGPLVWAQRAVIGALRLTDALAQADPAAVRTHLDEFVLQIPARGTDAESVDWLERGRMALARHLSGELASSAVRVDVGVDRFTLGWRVGSLIELINLQLFEHLQRHPDFGIGWCDYCGMPILRVRRVQRYHSGCAPAGRQRESRAKRKSLRTREEG